MKIKLTTPGYAAFTGWIGDVQFDNGTSISEVKAAQAAFVRAMHSVEEVEDEAPEEELTPAGQEGGETTAQDTTLTSEEQNDVQEVAEEAAQVQEQAPEGDAPKE